MHIISGGTRTLAHCCTSVSWPFPLCFCISSLSWLATVKESALQNFGKVKEAKETYRQEHGKNLYLGGPSQCPPGFQIHATKQIKKVFLEDSSVQFNCSVVSDSLQPHELQNARLPCPSPTTGVHPNSCSFSRWCHLTISSSVVPFSSCLQSFPASGSFPMSQLFASGGQSIGVSASTSVPPMKTQDWSPLAWTGWISLQSKGPSRVFSNTPVQRHQFFCAQLSLQSNSHIHTWLLEKP